LNFTKMYAYDPAGHLTALTLADGRTIHYTYDSNGNLTSLTPPGKSNHSFSYSKVNLLSSYTPPSLGIAGGASYAYSADRQMTSIVRPDGRSAGFAYDNAGRLNSMVTPSGTTQYAYSGSTGNLISASISGGEGLAYSYNGPLVTGSAWTGPVAGSVARGYDNNFWMISESVDGENPILFARDNDGLVTSAGSLLIQRNSQNTLIAGTTLGSVNDTRSYNGYGELTGYMATSGAATIWSVQYTRDALGRIATRTETIQGASKTVAYARDAAGRLTGVTLNGNGSAIYSYDSNSNRLTAVTASGTSAGTYDAQDRLLRYGNTAYTYNASGDLTSKVTGTQVTTYQYDVMGNLVAVSLPGGGSINYLVDAGNRRVGKLLNGAVIAGFLYNGNRIVAQLNAGGAVVSRFVYGTRPNAPDYIVKGGVTYRIFCDQLGSPRLVVNSSTGQIAERIDYDEFGNVTGDTNPGFQPFGFAGGLYDQDTGLVRFGARDYDPKTGRWTAKDPILFSGGSSNLYSYALNNPVDLYDPSGLEGTNEADGGSELVRDVAIQAGAEVAEHYVEAKGEQIIEKLATGEEEAGPPEFKPGATPLKEYEEVNKNAVETKPEVSTFSNFVQHIWQVCSDGLRGITSNSSQGTAQPAGSNDSTPAPGQRVPLPTFQPPDAGVQQ
jgi:RHS repeat-associated protein